MEKYEYLSNTAIINVMYYVSKLGNMVLLDLSSVFVSRIFIVPESFIDDVINYQSATGIVRLIIIFLCSIHI